MNGLTSKLPTWQGLQLICMVFLLCSSFKVNAQISEVNTIQNLSFGAFSHGSEGGTLTISNTGMRSATGTVVPVNLGYSYVQATFEIVAPNGTIISILNGPDAILSGSNGGTMSLRLGSSDPLSPFSVSSPTGKTEINIGGTLTLGPAATNPSGSYNGTFFITFNNE